MFDIILFDLDGTVTDPKIGITKSVQYALSHFGIDEPDLDKLEPFIGPPLSDSFREFYGLSDEQIPEAVKWYRERFSDVGLYENEIYRGMKKMLKDLKKHGKRLAVASSKPEPFVEKILDYFEISKYFEVVTGSNLDGTRSSKEEVVEEALRRLNAGEVQKERIAMVGDRKFDVYGAKQFGLVSVGVDYGYAAEGELMEAHADYIVKSVDELHEFLLRGGDKTNALKKYRKALRQAARRRAHITTDVSYREYWEQQKQKDAMTTLWQQIWMVCAPLAIYLIAYDIAGIVLTYGIAWIAYLVGGETAEQVLTSHEADFRAIVLMGSLLIATLCQIRPIKREVIRRPRKNPYETLGVREIILLTAMSVSTAIAWNLLFMLTGITKMSAQYEAASQNQYSVMLPIGIILYGFFSPMAEEAVFRGLIYTRIKRFFGITAATVMSAVFFSIYHGNLVQGLYAFIIGLLLAYMYELWDDWRVPVIIHAEANLASYLLSDSNIDFFADKSMGFHIINCVFFATISAFTIIYTRNLKKNQ